MRELRPTNADAGELVFKEVVSKSRGFSTHLKAAKISKVDTQGRVVDFHSPRHTFRTNLHRAGVSQREAMELMRHRDPNHTDALVIDEIYRGNISKVFSQLIPLIGPDMGNLFAQWSRGRQAT